jgi:hypothetical protein
MRAEKHYAELVFLQLVGSVRHILNSDASRLQNIDALFFMLGGGGIKSAPRHVC